LIHHQTGNSNYRVHIEFVFSNAYLLCVITNIFFSNSSIEREKSAREQGWTQDLSEGGGQDFLGTKKLIIRNKIKGLGQGFRNNKKIVQE